MKQKRKWFLWKVIPRWIDNDNKCLEQPELKLYILRPLHLYVVKITACIVGVESHTVLVGGDAAIDRPGVGRRNLELDCQSKFEFL